MLFCDVILGYSALVWCIGACFPWLWHSDLFVRHMNRNLLFFFKNFNYRLDYDYPCIQSMPWGYIVFYHSGMSVNFCIKIVCLVCFACIWYMIYNTTAWIHHCWHNLATRPEVKVTDLDILLTFASEFCFKYSSFSESSLVVLPCGYYRMDTDQLMAYCCCWPKVKAINFGDLLELTLAVAPSGGIYDHSSTKPRSLPLVYLAHRYIFLYAWIYSPTSMAQTSFGPWKFVLNIGSFSHWGLIIVPGQEANEDNLGMSFRSSIK